MKTVFVLLDSMEKVTGFVRDVSGVEGRALIPFGMSYVDAKSIVAVFTLDLTKALRLEIENWKEDYAVLLKRYLIL